MTDIIISMMLFGKWGVIIWAILGICLVITGLYINKAYWRFTGLLALLSPLIIEFMSRWDDLSNIERPLILGALGLILLGVGFIYSKFEPILLKRLRKKETLEKI